MRVFSATLSLTALLIAGGTLAQAAPDHLGPTLPKIAQEAAPVAAVPQLADFEAASRAPAVSSENEVLYTVLSDQIREMRRKAALPTVMCLAESNADGSAQTLPRDVMDQLVADNAKAGDELFTLKPATACETSGSRIVDAATHGRAMLVTAGPMEDEMKGLMADCGDFVGGFVRAEGDSDYDFYSINDGDVARKLGCELAQ